MAKGRHVEPQEYTQIVRESCPDFRPFDDEDEDDQEGIPDQSEPTRTLVRGPLTGDEATDIVNWMMQRIRCAARIPEGRAPTDWELGVAATVMQTMIWVIDLPPNPENPDEEGAAYVDMSALATLMDIIFVTPAKGKGYVRMLIHELAQRLMIAEVAREIFWAVEVRIEAPGWDNGRERHKLATRVEDGLMGKW